MPAAVRSSVVPMIHRLDSLGGHDQGDRHRRQNDGAAKTDVTVATPCGHQPSTLGATQQGRATLAQFQRQRAPIAAASCTNRTAAEDQRGARPADGAKPLSEDDVGRGRRKHRLEAAMITASDGGVCRSATVSSVKVSALESSPT